MKALNKEKINKYINIILDKIFSFIYKYKYILIMTLPFIAMDITTRLFGNNINFYKIYRLAPNLFTLSWIILFIGLSLSFKKKVGKSRHLSPSTTLKLESIHGKSRTKFMFSCLKTSDVCLNLHYFSVVIFTIHNINYSWL